MIKKGKSLKKFNIKTQVLQGIEIAKDEAKIFNLELVKYAKFENHFVSLLACSCSGSASQANSENHSKFCRGFCLAEKVGLKGSVPQGSLIRKVLKRAAKYCAALTVIQETDLENNLVSWISLAKCCSGRLPATAAILVAQKERIVSTKGSVFELGGFRMHSEREFCIKKNSDSSGDELEVEIIKSNSLATSEDAWKDDREDLNDQMFKLNSDCEETVSLGSISLILRELPESSLGWPLLGRINQSHQDLGRRRERNMSVVEWAMSLHSRSSSIASQKDIIDFEWNKTNSADCSLNRESEQSILQRIHSTEDESTDRSMNPKDKETTRKLHALEKICTVGEGVLINQKDVSTSPVVCGWPLLKIAAPASSDLLGESEDKTLLNQSTPAALVSPETDNHYQREIPYSEEHDDENNLTPSAELFLKLVSFKCKQFSYEELKQATSQFSPDNLIGEGGCSNVYKGCLPDGKQVAVKVLKSYKEAWNDFSLEVDITSSLKHKSITTLLGICTEDNNLMLVSEFLPEGSLEESLHGAGKESVVPWEVRFNVAVATAEALNYLHNKCPHPVIHRDVKSSNILLSSEFQPQLSDFGLAIWGPTDSTYTIHEDVVGTFGYIAPEYFMHGRVSDKIDVYSFGVVLLELLSGRRPIRSKNMKGQQSLVKWAKPILKNGEAKALLDPKLDNDYDNAQMHRMFLAANLCINQSPRLRPNMNQILKLLRGEEDAKEWVDSHVDDVKGSDNQEDDDFYDFGVKPRLDFSILDIDFDAISLGSSVDATSHFVTEQKPKSLISTERKQHLKLKDYFFGTERKQHLKLKDYLLEEQD